MASDYDLWQALRAAMSRATAGLSFIDQVGIEWPSDQYFGKLIADEKSAIIVYDPDMARPTTRWKKIRTDIIKFDCKTKTLASASGLAPAEVGTITLSANTTLTPTPTKPATGDAVSCVINYHTKTRSVVAIANPIDSYASLATKLSAAINNATDPDFVGILAATASGAVVTVTNIGSHAVNWNSYAGNNGAQILELAREERTIQIACFCSSFDQRSLLATVVKEAAAALQANFGVVFADGTAARVLLKNNRYFCDYHRNDLWRFDQYVACDQGITTLDALYSVIAPHVDKTPGY